VDGVPRVLVEASVQALGEQDVGVETGARGPGVEPPPPERGHRDPPSLGVAGGAHAHPPPRPGVAHDGVQGVVGREGLGARGGQAEDHPGEG
jgi:hypothetical protein